MPEEQSSILRMQIQFYERADTAARRAVSAETATALAATTVEDNGCARYLNKYDGSRTNKNAQDDQRRGQRPSKTDKFLPASGPENREVGVVNAERKPLPLKELCPPLHTARRVARFSTSLGLVMARRFAAILASRTPSVLSYGERAMRGQRHVTEQAAAAAWATAQA